MMLVTKHAAELCALLVDELYGELPSRIFASLLSKGRSTLPQLAQHTALTPRQVRHGLAVLVQFNLLFHQPGGDAKGSVYEACPEAAYNLVRTGKILDTIETLYGPAAKDVVHSLLLLGHARIGDLKQAYMAKIQAWKKSQRAHKAEDDEADGGHSHLSNGIEPLLKSGSQLNSVLCRLLEIGVVEVVHTKTFQSPDDIYHDIEESVEKYIEESGLKGMKAKEAASSKIAHELQKVRWQSQVLKRKLEGNNGFSSKRRKLFHGIETNGHHGVDTSDDEESDPLLDPLTVVRINFERCLVELRNSQLARFASDILSETTGSIYGVLLRLLTNTISRCRPDPLSRGQGDDESEARRVVTSQELLDHITSAIDPSTGIGKASSNDIDIKTAEKITAERPMEQIILDDEAEVVGQMSSDESEESDSIDSPSEDDEDDAASQNHKPASHVNGNRNTKVKFEDATTTKRSRADHVRQHLLLLSKSEQNFVRHCARDAWTVDFDIVLEKLREHELDIAIERTCGRQGIRLVRILRQKGKLEEKALCNLALMNKKDVQSKTADMQVLGYIDVQEVPKDNSRNSGRTIFLYFTEIERSLSQLLDRTYKTMLRCMQVLEHHRQKEKDVLMLTKRTDVKGHEKEMMQKAYYDKYSSFLEVERQILGHVMRLDDLVSILRDF